MNISLEDLDVDVVRSTAENEDRYDGRWGWYWHEVHRKPRGPFADPASAIHDLADWVRRTYVEPAAPLSGDAQLASIFLRNAAGFLDCGEAAGRGEAHLASCCYALELLLKGYLLSRGFSDAWNAEHLGHDLAKAHRLAVHHGFPSDDARIDGFIDAVSAAFIRHGLIELHAEHPALTERFEIHMALRSLHRDVSQRMTA